MTKPMQPAAPKRSKHLQEITTYFGPEGSRVETGPVQFGQDWPGVFIRGDNACGYALALRQLLRNPEWQYAVPVIEALAALLESCNVRNLQEEPPEESKGEPDSAGADSNPPPYGDP